MAAMADNDIPENPPGEPNENIRNAVNIDLAANVFNNNRNRNLPPNDLMHVRDRLFHAIYFKVAIMYAQIVPKTLQRALEYFILCKALLFFFALVYIHMTFIKNPVTCLQNFNDWPKDGVLRVEIVPNLHQQQMAKMKSQMDDKLLQDLQINYFNGVGPQTQLFREYERKLAKAGYELERGVHVLNNTKVFHVKAKKIQRDEEHASNDDTTDYEENRNANQHIVEYSLEYGHLRLSTVTRKRLKIPVYVVQLDPSSNKCFGNGFSRFLIKQFLGYDDLLMASVRVIAEQENNKGYLRNVITGEHFSFVAMWWPVWSSYPAALTMMLLFTFSISMLLRFAHHQIFIFIVDLLQMLEFNFTARFPMASLMTVILALIGTETVMSEFFNDASTAVYIILIVWVADQYDAICCHTSITKRHWPRFFFLFHFLFYAYHYRYCGLNNGLALICSWLFTQHSMLYFFHHHELPVIIHQTQILIIARNQNALAAAAMGHHQQQQQQQQPQQQQPQAEQSQQHQQQQQQQQHQPNSPVIVMNRIFRNHRFLDAMFVPRFPFGWPLTQSRVMAVNSFRRALFGLGRIAPVQLRVHISAAQRNTGEAAGEAVALLASAMDMPSPSPSPSPPSPQTRHEEQPRNIRMAALRLVTTPPGAASSIASQATTMTASPLPHVNAIVNANANTIVNASADAAANALNTNGMVEATNMENVVASNGSTSNGISGGTSHECCNIRPDVGDNNEQQQQQSQQQQRVQFSQLERDASAKHMNNAHGHDEKNNLANVDDEENTTAKGPVTTTTTITTSAAVAVAAAVITTATTLPARTAINNIKNNKENNSYNQLENSLHSLATTTTTTENVENTKKMGMAKTTVTAPITNTIDNNNKDNDNDKNKDNNNDNININTNTTAIGEWPIATMLNIRRPTTMLAGDKSNNNNNNNNKQQIKGIQLMENYAVISLERRQDVDGCNVTASTATVATATATATATAPLEALTSTSPSSAGVVATSMPALTMIDGDGSDRIIDSINNVDQQRCCPTMQKQPTVVVAATTTTTTTIVDTNNDGGPPPAAVTRC